MPPDDPPQRRTPRTPSGRYGDGGLPRPAEPDLYEAFQRWLRQYRDDERDGVSMRAVLDEVTRVGQNVDAFGIRLGDHERTDAERFGRLEGQLTGQNQAQVLSALQTGSHTVPVGGFPPPVPTSTGSHVIPPAPATPKPVPSIFSRAITPVLDRYLPAIVAAAAAYAAAAAHGCH